MRKYLYLWGIGSVVGLVLFGLLVPANAGRKVTSAALVAPVLTTPTAGACVPQGTIRYEWAAVAGATRYRLEVTRVADVNWTNQWHISTAAPTFYDDVTPPLGDWKWRVRARTSTEAGPWSEVRQFTVAMTCAEPTPTPTETTVSPTPTESPSPTATTPPPTGRWQPTPDHPWSLHWVLGDALDVNDPVQMGLRDFSGNVLPAPEVYDIDGEYNPKSTVDYLHAQGKKAICYFDAGVYETYRSDASRFPAEVIGNKDGSWEGSFWLDIRRVDILGPIMRDRMQMCVDKGFDMIEPDEIDGWENNTGFPLTYQDQLNYNRWLADTAHSLGISILQKGDIIQTQDLVNYFDATLNEECFQYNECLNPWNPVTGQEQVGLQAYVAQNKIVWNAEYKFTLNTTSCATARTQKWSLTWYKLGLPNNGGRQPCAYVNTGTW